MLCLLNILLNNVKNSTNKYAIRTLASRKHGNYRKKVQEDSPLEDIEDADHIDLSTLEQSSKQMYRDVELVREREKYLIVKQKYFKTYTPNFLSWNEKMKIRNLYSKDPEEWSIDKLTESFPALPYAISKIIQAKWMKSSTIKITKHDEVVQKNWEEFQNGNLELPDDLVEHLNKFTNRESNTLHLLDNDLINITPPKPEPHPNSFEAIITSYEKIKPQQIELPKPEAPQLLLESSKLASITNNQKELTPANNLKENKTSDFKSERVKRKPDPIFTIPGFNS